MNNTTINLGTQDKAVITGKINISIDFRFDTTTKELVIGAAATTIEEIMDVPSYKQLPTVTRELTRTERVYYLLLLGSGKISESLLPNTTVNVSYKGQSYKGVMHSTTRGRVSKLQPLYSANPELAEEGTVVKVTYDIGTNTLEVENISK